jgi:hypothetical protein
MRKTWTTKLATVALAALVGSGLAAINASAAEHGRTGDPYDKGKGYDGYKGWEIVTVPTATVPNFTQRTAYCPPGKKVTGGGANATGVNPILLGDFPTSDGTGWVGVGRSSTSGDVGISVYAVCAKVS